MTDKEYYKTYLEGNEFYAMPKLETPLSKDLVYKFNKVKNLHHCIIGKGKNMNYSTNSLESVRNSIETKRWCLIHAKESYNIY